MHSQASPPNGEGRRRRRPFHVAIGDCLFVVERRRRRRRRIVPAILQSYRDDVNIRRHIAGIGCGGPRDEPRIGGTGEIDRGAFHEQMRIGEVEGHLRRQSIGRSHRQPIAVVVRQQWHADLIGDRRLLVADAAADGELIVPLIFGTDREEPAVFKLERQGHRIEADQRHRAVGLGHRRSADAAPVGPFCSRHHHPLRRQPLPQAEADDVGHIDCGADRARRGERRDEGETAGKRHRPVDLLVDRGAIAQTDRGVRA
jgi:hypothetical protein